MNSGNKIWLTIVIATCNRLWKLENTIKELIKYPQNDIEIIISDDSSNLETEKFFSMIQDNRICYMRREGVHWIKEQILPAINGEYMMWLLDKDSIIVECLGEFIQFLREHREVIYGRCFLPKMHGAKAENKYVIYEKGYEGLKAMGFREMHPSGFFVQKSAVSHMSINALEYSTECWDAYLAIQGKSAFYNYEIINVESKEEAVKTKSLTYKNEDDFFFAPANELKKMELQLQCLYDISVSEVIKKELITDIVERYLLQATVGYQSILGDESVCAHYNTNTRNVSKKELFSILFRSKKRVFKYIRQMEGNTVSVSLKVKLIYVFIKCYYLVLRYGK